MDKISHVLEEKGRAVHTIEPSATVYEAIKQMVAHNVGSLIVMADGEVAGIITERDYLRQIALKGRSSRTTEVAEIMTRDVACVTPDHSIEECMAIMTQERCRHLPVLEGAQITGVVSTGDLIKHLVSDQRVEIEHLTKYICGKYPG